jgi:hypothetical protein
MNYINANKFTLNAKLVDAYFTSNPRAGQQCLNIFFQDEHNLVLPGGRGTSRYDPMGTIPYIFDPTQRYCARVAKKHFYYSSDIILEYNMPNIINLKSANVFPRNVADRILYCPSIPFPYSNGRLRELPVITNFVNEAEPRRSLIIERLKAACPGYSNIQGVFDLAGLRQMYRSARIVVNTHQTWHHHSIEEFRVLPSLACGCIVISENVPLLKSIPYHDYIIWCDYEEIADVTQHVQANYEHYFEKIHGSSSGLSSLLENMKLEFKVSMDSLLGDKRLLGMKAKLGRRLLGRIKAWKVKNLYEHEII